MSSESGVDLMEASEEADSSRRIEIYPKSYVKDLMRHKAEEAGLPLAFMGMAAYASFSNMVDLMYAAGIFVGQVHDSKDRATLEAIFERNLGYRIKLQRPGVEPSNERA